MTFVAVQPVRDVILNGHRIFIQKGLPNRYNHLRGSAEVYDGCQVLSYESTFGRDCWTANSSLVSLEGKL